jgi:small subunit ribosomal protein S18
MSDLKINKKPQPKAFSKKPLGKTFGKPLTKTFGKQGEQTNPNKKSKNIYNKNIYWEQGLEAIRLRKEYYKNFEKNKNKRHKKKKSLQYIFYLKKFKSIVEYTNVRLLKVFLTKFAKIKAKRKTRVIVQQHRKIAKAIRKARIAGLLPFSCNIRLF